MNINRGKRVEKRGEREGEKQGKRTFTVKETRTTSRKPLQVDRKSVKTSKRKKNQI